MTAALLLAVVGVFLLLTDRHPRTVWRLLPLCAFACVGMAAVVAVANQAAGRTP